MSRKTEAVKKRKSGGAVTPDVPVPSGGEVIRTSAGRQSSASGSVDALENLGELPRSYDSDTIFLIAQEPRWLFTYWDIDISRHPGGKTFLRVYEGGASSLEAEIDVPFETQNWYIPVRAAGSSYTVEIGYLRGSTWNVIARSATVRTPSDAMSESTDFEFATIPFHLSFQKLMEKVQSSVRHGETFTQTLSRMQQDGDALDFGRHFFPNLPDGKHDLLEALFGEELLEELSSGAFGSEERSEEIEARIRRHLQEKLSSGGASELSASGSWGREESSLFSALSAAVGSEISSWTSPALASWAAGALGSWNSGRSAETSAAPSSWFLAAAGAWSGSSAFSSSLSPGLSSALSSWSAASLSSWSGASETLSSGSSSSFLGQPREFFMHVNAEVIFYGGTDPGARVTIDGKPITLNPDGTFRHHFIFPDGIYEIPIVATAPDGMETRGAILRFDRTTHKHGRVDDTVQPPLGAPMGER